jgi:2,3-bisphosphoglycerate-independent phosphoglycerate mutase
LAFAKKEFEGFLRSFLDLHFVTMTRYSDEIPADVAFPKEEVDFCLGFVLKQAQAKQLRIAETEKYAHVTFFFNGGKKEPFLEESRILVPSVRDVLTYDLNPQMSAFQVARFAVEEIQKKEKDFVLVNFANADMVGHTGNYAATVKAVECLDVCLQSVVNAAQQNGYVVMITADHGNAEQMCDDLGEKHTQHTVCPVPFLMVGEEKKALREGTLSDIMPTICEVMGLPIPEQVQGRAL